MRIALLYSMTVLLSLSGIVFAVAEGSPLAGFSLIVALATLFFVDLEEKFAVPPVAANLLGLLAFAVAGIEFFGGEIESRLLAGGHLIVYLTWVFMIQRKGTRHFWWLCALSVLQLATASVLTTHLWFGAALLLYSLVATWTLSIFLLYRSTLPSDSTAEMGTDSDVGSTFVVGDTWKGISRDVDARLLNWRFVTINGTVTFVGLLLSLLFFIFIPRVWIGQFSFLSDDEVAGRPLTGFTDEVRLGDMGEILENDDVVLELELLHTATKKPFSIGEYGSFLGPDPLFRGTIMEMYENGRWKQLRQGRPERFSRSGRNAEVTQRYQVYSIGSPALFSFGDMTNAYAISRGGHVYRERYSDELKRGDSVPLTDQFKYAVNSTLKPFDTHSASERNSWPRFFITEFLSAYQFPLRQVPDDMQPVRALAKSVVESATSDTQKAEMLERYFTDSDEFTYSLDLSIDDASIDPIQDFLLNRKTGHCEYYASSMAIMLRSVGIPSRLVSGFKGGTYDKNKQLYSVKQFHAHSWVEAYLNGKWRTFDPTPSTRNVIVREKADSASSFRMTFLKMKSYWSTGVQFSKSEQQTMVYQPLQKMAIESWNNAKDIVQGRTSGLKDVFVFLTSPDRWLSLQGAVAVFVFSLIIAGFVWVGRRVVWFLNKLSPKDAKAMQRVQYVEFYARLLKLLKRRKISQTPTQTAREFVQSAFIELKPELSRLGLEAWPDDLVTKFYGVRFGGLELQKPEIHEIDRRLSELETCLMKQEESNK